MPGNMPSEVSLFHPGYIFSSVRQLSGRGNRSTLAGRHSQRAGQRRSWVRSGKQPQNRTWENYLSRRPRNNFWGAGNIDPDAQT